MGYDAFLSYSRRSPRSVAAVARLHRRIEAFPLPEALCRRISDPHRRRLYIFRDVSDLALAGDLAAELRARIAESRFLVVACSPEAAQSPWVALEIDCFRQENRTVGNERILAVVVEGDPHEVIPVSLRPGGIIPNYGDLRPMHPGEGLLACRERHREETIRLIAAMLGVPFDELRRRDRARRKKLALIGMGAAILLMVVLVGMTLWAWNAMQEARFQQSVAQAREHEAQRNLAKVMVEKARSLESLGMVSEAAALYSRALEIVEDPVARGGANRGIQLARTAFVARWDVEVTAAVFSPDGTQIVAGCDDGTLRVWDKRTRQEISRVQAHVGAILGLRFSPKGNLVVSASVDRSVKGWRWPLDGTDPVLSLAGGADPGGHAGLPIAFSADGTRLAFSGPDRSVVVEDLLSGSTVDVLPDLVPISLNFHPSGDGSILVYGWGENSLPGTIRWWPGRPSPILFSRIRGRGAAMSSDGARMAQADDDFQVMVLSAWDGSPVRRMPGHTNTVTSLAFDPTGSLLVSGEVDGSAILWDLVQGTMLARLGGVRGTLRSVAFSPSGDQILVASSRGGVCLWDVRPPRRIAGVYPDPGRWMLSATFSPDNTLVATAGTNLRLWDLATGDLVWSVPWDPPGWGRIAFSPDGEWLLAGSGYGNAVSMVHVRRERPNRILPTGVRYSENTRAVAQDPNGRYVAATVMVGLVLWEANSGRRIGEFPVLNGAESLAFHPDGNALAVASRDGTIVLVSVPDLSLVDRLPGHALPCRDVAFDPSGRWLASVAQEEILVWDLWERRIWTRLVPERGGLCLAVAFRPGNRPGLATACGRSSYLWDFQTGACIAETTVHGKILENVAFNQDGRLLVSTADDEVAIVVALDDLDVSPAILRRRAEAACGCQIDGATITYP